MRERVVGRWLSGVVGLLIVSLLGVVTHPTEAEAAGGTTLFFLTAAEADPVGEGLDIQTTSLTVSRPANDRLRFISSGSPQAIVEIIDPSGSFVPNERWQGPAPVLTVSVAGRTCALFGSDFRIDEIEMNGTIPSRIAVRFSYNCGAPDYAESMGTIALDATVPVFASTFSPKSFTFTTHTGEVGTAPVTLTNVGPAPLEIVGYGGGTSQADNGARMDSGNCPPKLASGASCTATVVAPANVRGRINGTASVSDSMTAGRAGAGQHSVSVTGLVAPAVGTARFSADSELNDPAGRSQHDVASNFGLEQWLGSIGGTAANDAWFVALGRSPDPYPPVGLVTSTSQSGVYFDAYAGTTHCPEAQRTGTFLIDDFAVSPTNGTQVIRYSGRFRQRCNGDPTAELFGSFNLGSTSPFYSHSMTPKLLSFGSVQIDTTAPLQNVTITNDGTSGLAISSLRIGGSNPRAFTLVSSSCPATLSVGASCVAKVSFHPTTAEFQTATLELVDSLTNFAGDGASQDVVLRGYGMAVPPTPPSTTTPSPTTTTPTTTTPTTTTAPPAASTTTTAPESTTTPPAAPADTSAIPANRYVSIDPSRLLDTRVPIGRAVAGPLQPGEDVAVAVAGRFGIPSSGVDSVAINVTAVGSDADGGYFTVYPGGQGRPATSNLNFDRGGATPNMAIVAVGDDGTIRLANGPTTAHAIIDVVGYFGDPPPGGESNGVHMLRPDRVLDTRNDYSLNAGTHLILVAGRSGVPRGATAVIVNVTGLDASADTFVTLFASGFQRPPTSTLNLRPGEIRPNLAIVQLGMGGALDAFVERGTVDLLVDVVAWIGRTGVPTASETIAQNYGGGLLGVAPDRIFDTRVEPPAFGPDTVDYLLFPTSINGHRVTGAVLNVTVTNPTDGGYLTVFPGDVDTIPEVSNLNFSPGQTIANLVTVKVPADGDVWIYNPFGDTDVIVDVMGLILE